MFQLYVHGVISLEDLFTITEDKYAKLKEDLKLEIEKLFCSREESRRVKSDILRPWNDLEH